MQNQIKLTPTILTKLNFSFTDIRHVLAKNTFSQEFTRVPECLIKDGRPYHSDKSDILEVIAPKSKAANPTEVVVGGLVIDLSMIIRSLKTRLKVDMDVYNRKMPRGWFFVFLC